jgi:hypothetical protein
VLDIGSDDSGAVEESAELKPIDCDQVLEPAKFRISGYDDGVHADRGGSRESVRVGDREASLESGCIKNISERVWYGLNGEGLVSRCEIP